MDKLQAMKVFEQVVAENGFAAGARKLALSPSVVTRLVGDLENHLGVRLLQRTTRRLALTPAGESYLDRLRGILSEIDDAEEAVHSHAREMSGSVRVASLPGMATHLVAPAIAEFRRLHPKVTIELRSDVYANRSIESHDITLLTDLVPLPAGVVTRPVVRSQNIFCASPDYVRRHGAPQAPQDLLQHAYIRVVLPGVPSGSVRFLHEDEPARTDELTVAPVLCCNDHEAVLRSTVEGAGISSQVLQVAAPLLRAGHLQRVLAPWLAERFTLLACFASRRHVPPRTRAFLDHLIRHATLAQEAKTNRCEVTGIAMTPDGRTMGVGIQHPGEDATAANPMQYSNWPQGPWARASDGVTALPAGRQRSSVVVVTKNDGGVIGS